MEISKASLVCIRGRKIRAEIPFAQKELSSLVASEHFYSEHFTSGRDDRKIVRGRIPAASLTREKKYFRNFRGKKLRVPSGPWKKFLLREQFRRSVERMGK